MCECLTVIGAHTEFSKTIKDAKKILDHTFGERHFCQTVPDKTTGLNTTENRKVAKTMLVQNRENTKYSFLSYTFEDCAQQEVPRNC